MGRYPDEPHGQRLGLSQLLQLGQQQEADPLEDVGRVVPGDALFDGDGEDEVLVLLQERRPGVLAAAEAGAHQARIRPGELVPSAVRTLIQRRAARLPDDARSILADAAVLGRSFSLRDLSAVRSRLDEAEPAPGSLADALKPAVEAGLLLEQPEGSSADYTFTLGDSGSHSIEYILKTPGSQTITVTDVGDSRITASRTVVVEPASKGR